MLTPLWTICRRELASYFATPVALVFIVVFLALSAALTFFVGNFFVRGQADLQSFFMWHPWLYLFLIPAMTMRLWAEEHKTGTIEMLLTLPMPLPAIVLGKFLAAWLFTGLALALTFPIWIAVNVLGRPDNGVIIASYFGSFLMAGAFLSIGACLSAVTKNQVIAFVLTACLCFLFTVSGSPVILAFFSGWAPEGLLSLVAGLSFLEHFQAIMRGVVDVRDGFYFLSVITLFLFMNTVIVEWRKA